MEPTATRCSVISFSRDAIWNHSLWKEGDRIIRESLVLASNGLSQTAMKWRNIHCLFLTSILPAEEERGASLRRVYCMDSV